MNLKDKKGITIMALIIAVIAVIIVVGIVWSKTHKKQEENNQIEVSQEENTNTENVVEEKYVEELSDGSKLNTSSKLNKDKKLGNLTITNIQFREVEGITRLIADVENTSNEKTEKKRVNVKVLDEQGNKIAELKGIIDPIEAKGTTKLNMGVTIDVSNAYDFEISEE